MYGYVGADTKTDWMSDHRPQYNLNLNINLNLNYESVGMKGRELGGWCEMGAILRGR
jgi:hypothetical protein